MRTAGGFGKAEHCLRSAGVSDGWNEVLTPMKVVQCNPCPLFFPLEIRGWSRNVACLSHRIVQIHLLGMRCCGGCRWPPGKADQAALGASLYLCANPKVESTCSTGIWGSLFSLHQCPGGPVTCAWPFNQEHKVGGGTVKRLFGCQKKPSFLRQRGFPKWMRSAALLRCREIINNNSGIFGATWPATAGSGGFPSPCGRRWLGPPPPEPQTRAG